MAMEKVQPQKEFDAFTAQVIQSRLKSVVEEMATTLLRTSGSPVLTEAQDFSTAVFDVNGEHIAFSGYVVAHIGSSLIGVQAVLREYELEDIHPGDAFICNDVYSAGAIHQGDVGIISPIFYQDELVGWSFSNAHVLDVGGMSPGGWAPAAYDVYSEAISFPAVRIMERGRMNRDIQRILMNNVRLPIPVINDVKSLIAANITAERRVNALIDKYGLEDYKRYCEINKDLAEQTIRKRIRDIPNGVYHTKEWVEYDGHGADNLYPVECKLTVEEDHLHVDLSGSSPQADGFINAGPGAIYGGLYGVIAMTIGCDIPVNAGMLRPLTIELGPPGTIVNPVIPAPVSCGHMETTGKAGKAFYEGIFKALQLSENPWLRNRVAAIGHNNWPGNSWVGLDQYGQYTAFPAFDCGSGGVGAQATCDGLDIGAFEMQQNNGIPDVETNEGLYPMFYFYRKINVNSGGPGYHRGGQGMDYAWMPYNNQGLLGTIENACAEMPAHGTLGGYPGGTSSFNKIDEFDINQFIAEHGRLPIPNELTNYTTLPNHIAGMPLGPKAVFKQVTGGGAGIGDPLLRPIAIVEKDLQDEYITPDLAEKAYGVIWNASERRVDLEASHEKRRSIRRDRIGRNPEVEVSEQEKLKVPLKFVHKAGKKLVSCNFCDHELSESNMNWKEGAVQRKADLVETMSELGIYVQPRESGKAELHEAICPSCGTLLQQDVLTEEVKEFNDYVLTN
ncbi:hydantoinase B/oxoprolinase family protein [Neobacillus sp. GCM10023253]|uniref:hydantoinase B/oxoprolinase family protein n=1 Tax=Neobacillus sp. GCM10023253 TaxID=3252644 RepID=UPI0036167AE6